jgi:hypothetical protein
MAKNAYEVAAPRPARVRIGQALMALAAVSAFVAAVSDIATVVNAPASTAVVETWRLCGFALFTGLFALLAARPSGYRGLWELAIANKLALTAAGVGYAVHGHIDGTSQVLLWDGSLTVLLIVAYIACQPWRKARYAAVADAPGPARTAGGRVLARSATRR